MQLSEFNYHLPPELIAKYPAKERVGSRLLVLDKDIQHAHFSGLLDLLKPNDLLVFNNSRVIPARLFGQKETGGQLEVLVERLLNDAEVLAHVRASKSPKPGSIIRFEQGLSAEMLKRDGDLFHLKFSEAALDVLHKIGHMPLPPYINRDDEQFDQERYQTVYAAYDGSVAAPTAGLHFDEALLEKLQEKNIQTAFVTLHVGAGTFQPVRTENITDHHMHAEWIEVPQAVIDQMNQTKEAGGRVIAVGTTSVRCLETAKGQAYLGDTDIFIYPPYKFHTVDALITNFHLPKSSLLMLVCAFGGYQRLMNAYQVAIEEKYRFYSYGDAMFIAREE